MIDQRPRTNDGQNAMDRLKTTTGAEKKLHNTGIIQELDELITFYLHVCTQTRICRNKYSNSGLHEQSLII